MAPPVLLSTAYFPPVTYFVAIANADYLMLEKHETYQKQTFRNRCEIYSANGRLPLTIPVNKTHGNHTKIDHIQISDQYNWQLNHWRAIVAAYTNSPYFLYYGDVVYELIFCPEKNLFNFNLHLISRLLKILGMEKEIRFTEVFVKDQNEILDYRNRISPKANVSGPELKPYYQTFGDKFGFIQGLSILDLLFNLGPECRSFLQY